VYQRFRRHITRCFGNLRSISPQELYQSCYPGSPLLSSDVCWAEQPHRFLAKRPRPISANAEPPARANGLAPNPAINTQSFPNYWPNAWLPATTNPYFSIHHLLRNPSILTPNNVNAGVNQKVRPTSGPLRFFKQRIRRGLEGVARGVLGVPLWCRGGSNRRSCRLFVDDALGDGFSAFVMGMGIVELAVATRARVFSTSVTEGGRNSRFL